MSQYLKVTVSLVDKSKQNPEKHEVILTEVEKILPENHVTVEEVERVVRGVSNEARKNCYFKTLEKYDTQISEKRQHVTPECEVIFAGKKKIGNRK